MVSGIFNFYRSGDGSYAHEEYGDILEHSVVKYPSSVILTDDDKMEIRDLALSEYRGKPCDLLKDHRIRRMVAEGMVASGVFNGFLERNVTEWLLRAAVSDALLEYYNSSTDSMRISA